MGDKILFKIGHKYLLIYKGCLISNLNVRTAQSKDQVTRDMTHAF